MTRDIDNSTLGATTTSDVHPASRGLGQAFAIWIAAILLVAIASFAAMGPAHSSERIAVMTMSDAISQASNLSTGVDMMHTGSVPTRTVHGIRALEKHDLAFGGIMLLFFGMSFGLYRLWRSTIDRMTGSRR
ncbi:MAG: hypothetical protein R3D02_05370 [Hyphomicrobiales bacterium]